MKFIFVFLFGCAIQSTAVVSQSPRDSRNEASCTELEVEYTSAKNWCNNPEIKLQTRNSYCLFVSNYEERCNE